jgi:hypothetical protein
LNINQTQLEFRLGLILSFIKPGWNSGWNSSEHLSNPAGITAGFKVKIYQTQLEFGLGFE